MQCEICGKEAKLVSAIIEDVKMNVCSECASFGKVLRQPVEPTEIKAGKTKKPEEEKVEIIVPDFARKIRKAREKLGLEQEKFGQKLGIKESIIHKIETGDFKPSIEMARKMEKILNIKLVMEYSEEKKTYAAGESEGFTIGDLIKKT
jgi:putative transcription factor